jgi:hypothetical protein
LFGSVEVSAMPSGIYRRLFLLTLLASAVLATHTPALGQAKNAYRQATIVSVRQNARNGSLLSRYSSTHVFNMDFTVRLEGHNYCAAYQTIVLDEAGDLRNSSEKEVSIEMLGNRMIVILPSGRKIRAQLADNAQC